MTRLQQCCLLLGLTLAVVPAAVEGSEVTTMAGTSHQGNLLKVTEQEVQLQGPDGKPLAWKTAEILSVDLSKGTPVPPKDAYIRVQLRDGTTLVAKSFAGRGDKGEVTFLSGVKLQVPWSALQFVLFQANHPEHATAFEAQIAQKPKQDMLWLLSRNEKDIITFKGSLGEPDAQGKLLRFQPEGGSPVSLQWERLRGLHFAKPATASPAAVCRVVDNAGNVFSAVTLATERQPPLLWGSEETWVRLQTPAGLQARVKLATVLRFDFSLGKVVYLSDLEPLRVEKASALEENPGNVGYQRDKTIYQTPLTMGGKSYAKGLAMRSRTVLDFDVEGYNRFQALIGIDDNTTGPTDALVKIEGDGRELFSSTVSRRDVKPKEIELRISGLKRLRITVDYGDGFDLGDHVNLANARIMK